MGPALLYGILGSSCAVVVLLQADAESNDVVVAISTVLGLTVAALSTLRFIARRRRLYLLVAIGFLGSAVLDLHHVMVTSHWFFPDLPCVPEDLELWSWLGSRVHLGGFMVLAGWRLYREKIGAVSVITDLQLKAMSLGFILLVISILHSGPLGPLHRLGAVGRIEEIGAGALFLLGFVLAVTSRPWTPRSFVPWLVVSMGLAAISQLFIVPFSTELYDLPFRLGHIFRILSIVAVGVGLLFSVVVAFRAEEELSARLREERRRLAEILWSTDTGTWEWDVRGGLVIINERLAGILGFTRDELGDDLGRLWRSRCHPDDLAEAEAAQRAHLAGETEHYEAEFRLRHKDGGWVWVLDRGKVVEWADDGQAVRMSGTYQDVTARRAAEALAARQRDMLARDVATLQSQGRALARQADELSDAARQQRELAAQLQREVDRRAKAERRERHRALHDPLTELPNRRYLQRMGEEAIEAAREQGTALAVLFIDLDGFKAVNDTLGHAAGDLLLVAIASRLRARVRAADIVARVGGDEFIILLPRDCSAERASQLAASVVRTLGAPFDLRGAAAQIGASVGIALFPEHGGSFEALLSAADAAMYAVKQSGKGSWAVADPPAPEADRET